MATHPIDELQNLIRTLRSENGCPWDKKQTPESMGRYAIEEIYELTEAIESKDSNHVREELGDVLFLILFIVVMHEEQTLFTLKDVVEGIISKMTRRHPHVFGTDTVQSADEVKQRWQQLKKNENNSPQLSIPSKLPALMRAVLLSERIAPNDPHIDTHFKLIQLIENQWSQVKNEVSNQQENESNSLQSAIGALLFGIVNLARSVRIHPETALKDFMKLLENQLILSKND